MELPDPVPAHLVDPSSVSAEDTGAYRLLAADIASGVGVVAARHRRRDHAATVTGFLDVSWDPPTMLVSLFEEGRICEAVEESGAWALSLLRREHEGTANWLASPGNPVEGLLDRVPFRRAPHSGAPVLAGSLAWFELRTTAVHTAATHRLVVGEVVALGRGVPEGGAADPLVHFGRGYHGLRP
ncbi:flavin reductase family protein [Kocuria flava]|uniref:Oxidoreductase n=1 Tax=Kocuria flava TaxID=446860 RepID=A0A2N4SYQ8_9MICC|nr:flavin reductase family protein [Kocuria flava]PLC11112.1 oxidoreductase [Kocuria flava]